MNRNPSTHDHRESDSPIVPKKPPNKVSRDTAEVVEGRGLANGNPKQRAAHRTRSRESASSGLCRVRSAARREPGIQFTALLHHVTIENLEIAYRSLKRKAAPGVDGVIWSQYGENLAANLKGLHERIHKGAYRAKPALRRFIPKPDGRQRPLGIVTVEDKLVQRSVLQVMNAIYEEDFLGFSYGFRPGRHQHKALDALVCGISWRKVSWVLDADIRGFFDAIDHEWLMRFVEHRIGDRRVLRLIRKWLRAGVMEDGDWQASKEGTPQGSTISPLLANIYLHYVFDLWAHRWRQREARGDVIIVRFADDIVMGFQYKDDAQRFHYQLMKRLQEFKLELNQAKTHLIEFGRFAKERAVNRRKGKPSTFNFLGFTHICGTNRKGDFFVQRRTMGNRMREKLKAIKSELRRRMHEPVYAQGRWLRSVINGYLNYHAVPGNLMQMDTFRYRIVQQWHKILRRRSQNDRTNWARTNILVARWLPRVCNRHPWPDKRVGRHHRRQEPGAGKPLAGICAGGTR